MDFCPSLNARVTELGHASPDCQVWAHREISHMTMTRDVMPTPSTCSSDVVLRADLS